MKQFHRVLLTRSAQMAKSICFHIFILFVEAFKSFKEGRRRRLTQVRKIGVNEAFVGNGSTVPALWTLMMVNSILDAFVMRWTL